MKRETFVIVIRMWHLVKRYRIRFYTGFLVGSTSIFFYRFLDSFLVEEFTKVCVREEEGALFYSVAAACALLLFGMVIYPLSFGLVYTTYSLMAGEIKKMVFDKMLKMAPSYIEYRYSGDLLTRVTSDYCDAVQLIAYPVVGQGNPFSIIFAIGMIAVVILWKSPLLGGISLVLTAAGFFVIRHMVEPMAKKEKKAKEFIQSSSQGIVDSLSGMMVFRMFGLTEMLVKRYENDTEDIYRNNLSLIRKKSLLALVIDTQGFISFTAVCAIGLFLCTKGLITIPTALFISLLQMSLGVFLRELSAKLAEMQKYIEGARRLFAFLDAPEEELRPVQAEPDFGAENAVELNDICFQYAEGKEELFHHFSMEIANGEKIGIAGGSGGGKTTLIKLLLGLLEPLQGQIRLFGRDVQMYSQAQVRSLFSYVPQDCYLFDGTIRENILVGNPDATEEELEKAVENAYLTDFIKSIPEGLDKRVGERGTLLSGGQRQRVAIARAFLRDAAILLLDEATSALDSRSEESVQKSIEKLMEGRTSIVIAHRLSTIRNMDRILVLEEGCVEENGTHEELLVKKGRYYHLYRQNKSGGG